MQPTMFDKVLEELRDPLTFTLSAITIAATYILGGLLLLIVMLLVYLLLKAIPVGEEGSAGFIVITRTLVVIVSLILLAGNIKPDGAAPLLLLVASSISLMRVLLSVKPGPTRLMSGAASAIIVDFLRWVPDEVIIDIDSASKAAVQKQRTLQTKILDHVKVRFGENYVALFADLVFPQTDWPLITRFIDYKAKAILATWQEPS